MSFFECLTQDVSRGHSRLALAWWPYLYFRWTIPDQNKQKKTRLLSNLAAVAFLNLKARGELHNGAGMPSFQQQTLLK